LLYSQGNKQLLTSRFQSHLLPTSRKTNLCIRALGRALPLVFWRFHESSCQFSAAGNILVAVWCSVQSM